MNIEQQITELLDGELCEVEATSELLHVLAVSPEKCVMFLDQIAIRRHIGAAFSASAPPARADAAIFAGLSTVDAGFAPVPTAEPVPAPAPIVRSGPGRLTVAAVVLLLLLLGGGAGYLLRGTATDGARARIVRVVTGAAPVAALGDSLASSRDSVATTSRGPMPLSTVRETPGRPPHRTSSSAARSDGDAGWLIDPPRTREQRWSADARSSATESSLSAGPTRTIARARALELDQALGANASIRHADVRVPAALPQPAGALPEAEPTPTGPWQIGGRTYFRSSLPRVYGLADSRTALFDKEFIADMRIGSSDGVLARLRAGAAFGETQFSILMHTNSGGAARDSIVEMSPVTFYARGYVAPEIVHLGDVLGGLELGGGYSGKVGGFGTFGLNVEYRPLPTLAGHVGASTWVLVSERGSSLYFSTNLNAYFGITYGF